MSILRNTTIVSNEINESGELVLKENIVKTKYFFGIKLFENIYDRNTSQTELKLKGDKPEIGFRKK